MQELKTPEQRADDRDKWETPEREYKIICETWNLFPTLDVAASQDNSKCQNYISEKMDALRQSWEPKNGVAWMNPPYSQPLMELFIQKAIDESTENGIAVVFLLPDNIDHEWFDLIEPFPHKVWRGPKNKPDSRTHRIRFIPPPGIKPSSPRNGNIHGVIDVWRRFV